MSSKCDILQYKSKPYLTSSSSHDLKMPASTLSNTRLIL